MEEQAERRAKALADAEGAREVLQVRLNAMGEAEERLRAEADANEAALAATTDDLRKIIRENQVLNHELQRAASERERSHLELRQAVSKAAHFERAVKAKEAEREELLASYRALGDDAAATGSSLHSSELECARLVSTVTALEAELHTAHGQSAALQSEHAQLALDLQTFERQNSQLTLHVADLDEALASARSGT